MRAFLPAQDIVVSQQHAAGNGGGGFRFTEKTAKTTGKTV